MKGAFLEPSTTADASRREIYLQDPSPAPVPPLTGDYTTLSQPMTVHSVPLRGHQTP